MAGGYRYNARSRVNSKCLSGLSSQSAREKHYICVIDQAWGQERWILTKFFSFCGVLMEQDEVEVHKNAKKKRDHYIATSKDLLYVRKNTKEFDFIMSCSQTLSSQNLGILCFHSLRYFQKDKNKLRKKICSGLKTLLLQKLQTNNLMSRLQSRKFFLAGTQQAIPCGQDSSIVPAWVAEQPYNSDFHGIY